MKRENKFRGKKTIITMFFLALAFFAMRTVSKAHNAKPEAEGQQGKVRGLLIREIPIQIPKQKKVKRLGGDSLPCGSSLQLSFRKAVS